MNEDTYAMVIALEALERVDISKRPGLYRQIHQYMRSYLRQYCEHNIVTDLIDIDLDRSEIIRYCEYCNLTFD